MTLLSVMLVSFEELCSCADINEAMVLELVEYQVIQPDTGDAPQEWLFSAAAVAVVKKAIRLQRDLQIDLADVALVVKLLEENETLQEENARLKQRLGRFVVDN